MTERSVLLEIDEEAATHEAEVAVIRQKLDIPHHYFDCWIYGFLKNKQFDIDETLAKLRRRFEMEVNELASYEITEAIRDSLSNGILQELGVDKLGRTVLYVCTRRDSPAKHLWEMRLKSFDMFISYATRLRPSTKRCQLVLLVDQKDASLVGNIDLRFQATIALRISKFYPGMVDKIYVCNMGRVLAACMKPIISALPAVVSSVVEVLTAADLRRGALRAILDPDELPKSLGGRSACDTAAAWQAFAGRVLDYYAGLRRGMREDGLSVKAWELREIGGGGAASDPGICRTPSAPSSAVGNSSRPSASRGAPATTCSETFTDATPDEASEDGAEQRTEWRAIMRAVDPSVALAFLEELLDGRTEIANQELYERFLITELAHGRLTEILKRWTSPSEGNDDSATEATKDSLRTRGQSRKPKKVPKKQTRSSCHCAIC